MDIKHVWAMPNSETFSIKPIEEFVWKYLRNSRVSIDPYARNKGLADWTNDINPNTSAEFHMDAEEFMAMLIEKNVKADLILLDGPYSPRQVKEMYNDIGRKMKMEDAWGGATKKRMRALVEQVSTPDCTVLYFGWNTNMMGKKAGWSIEEVLMVSHGSDHTNTICMAEKRII